MIVFFCKKTLKKYLEKGKEWFFFAAAFEQTGARSKGYCGVLAT